MSDYSFSWCVLCNCFPSCWLCGVCVEQRKGQLSFTGSYEAWIQRYILTFMYFGSSVFGVLGRILFFSCHFMLLMLYGLLSRCMERSVCSYHYDWYPDCTTVVHLRFCQGLFQTSSPTSTWNARISEEEAWSNWIDNSWTDCWLPQWWVSWNFYIFDYVENKLYTMSLLVVPSSHMRV